VSLVIDSSMALAWCFEDERTQTASAVLEQVAESGALVPSLWRLEVANGLEMAVRRKRINAAFRDATLADLQALAITVDGETDRHAWTATAQLAARWQLSLYDAAYLELARREALPLASMDEALCRAARSSGVKLFGKDKS
jgi:predicted nucleic acid-binding protein